MTTAFLCNITDKDSETLIALALMWGCSKAEAMRRALRQTAQTWDIEADTTELKQGRTSFYSNTGIGHVLKILKQQPHHFWDHVGGHAPDECWPRVGGPNYHIDGVLTHPPTIAWALENGRPPKTPIEPVCGNPGCCNPAHLKEAAV